MSKVLCIKVSPKDSKSSYSMRLATFFIEQYKELNPNDDIQIMDLYEEKPNFLTGLPDSNNEFVNNFLSKDKYILATPMWNFSIPAILKSYIDQITVRDKTFKVSPTGKLLTPLEDKKMVTVLATSNRWIGSNKDFASTYLKYIFSDYMGIHHDNYHNFIIHSTSRLTEEQLDFQLNYLKEEMKYILKTF